MSTSTNYNISYLFVTTKINAPQSLDPIVVGNILLNIINDVTLFCQSTH